MAQGAAVLVTMGCAEACPYVPGLQPLEGLLVDPEGKTKEEVWLQGGTCRSSEEIYAVTKGIHTKLIVLTLLRACLLLIDAGAGHQGPG